MEKQTAINLLGGTPMKAAKAMGYKSVQAVYLWPAILTGDRADRVLGVLSRLKPIKPTRKRTVEA
jgi:hypothetical protein